MGEVITFPRPDDDPDIDLLLAVEIAIRDLRDIARRCEDETSITQAIACCRMLERAYLTATRRIL
jgi:hypothetical protein